MSDEERIKWIDEASYCSLLSLNRFEPAGSPWFKGEVGKHFFEAMMARKAEDPEGAVADSKTVGWE